jgi:hypothetical protein
LLTLIDKQVRNIDQKVEQREDYLLSNKIKPEAALEFLEKQQTSEYSEGTGISKGRNAQVCRKSSKNKLGSDVASCGESLMTTSETYAYSSTTQLKSPSVLDTLSV